MAVVLGDMDLVRPLGLAGIKVAVAARAWDPVRFSRFVVTTVERPEGSSLAHERELLRRLLLFARDAGDPPVLFFEHDDDLRFVSRNRTALQPHFRVMLPDADLIEDLLDKARFAVLAERLQLPVPRTALLPREPDAVERLRLPFPAVVKPLIRDAEWVELANGAKVIRVGDRGELRRLAEDLRERDVRAVAQEVIEGPESAVESYHVYCDRSGDRVAEFTGRKIRTLPAEHGFSTAVLISEQADVARAGRRVVELLGLVGVAKVDFKRAPDGRLYLLEVNPRFSLWHHPGALAGVNIPALVYDDLVGNPRGPVGRAQPGIRWTYLWKDAQAARAAGVPPHRWFPRALASEAKLALAIDDPLPFLLGVAWSRARRARLNRRVRGRLS